jgi:oligopeptide/dipeptide ABC transporter ATP-binding protein
MALLPVSNLQKRFNLEAGFFARFGRFVNAVNGVSFSVGKNEAYGLVGESGCGKTTTARLLVRMYEADSGKILYHWENGQTDSVQAVDVMALRGDELRQYRGKIKYIFQDPARSLNPRLNVYEVLVSGLRWSITSGKRSSSHDGEKLLREKAAAALEEVGLEAADLDRRPSEFSGGQRQRISIARGLLPQPELLICDEVVSALDVSIQGQILNLLLDIREKREMSFLFIAHDLKVACYFCDRIGVMYSGVLMEEAPASDLWRDGRHPYTQMLFSSATGIKPFLKTETEENTKPPAPKEQTETGNTPPCCAFAPRCPRATSRCFNDPVPVTEVAPGHTVRCHSSK